METLLYTKDTVPEGVGFGSFSPYHLAWLAFAVVLFTFAAKAQARADETKRKRNLTIVAVLLLADEFLKYLITIPFGTWVWDYLPLHLCSISIFIAVAHRITGSKFLAEYLYAISLPSAAMALLFPNWAQLPALNLMCFHSFSVHVLIMLYPILLLAGGFRPDARNLKVLVPCVAGAACLIYVFNCFIDTNFFFMNGADAGNPLSILEKYIGGWYRLGIPAAAAILWIPVYLVPKKLEESKRKA